MTGKLLLLASPIGNLADASPRLREALAAADVVACEDTRRTAKLLASLGLKKSLLIYADHNEAEAARRVMRRLRAGETVALLTDGGTPLVADPGYPLLQKALEADVEVDFIPGPSAALAGLVLSGLPPYPYLFLGYAPRRRAERLRFLEKYASREATLVLFLTPHRLGAELADLIEAWGDRPAALARELTKVHQEVVRGKLSEIRAEVEARPRKGEMTLVVAGAETPEPDQAAALRLARDLLAEGLPPARAAAVAARAFGVPKTYIYREIRGG
ncbi:MAG: 16S rRNA (cytidine(1402)-2'-O)-methyltransferase [Candidatus Coatesbacteria bacterium]|nr:MAG: 16S rRNA (cytidine(1402)-2'-O)-methyltransferase [Candidatus Coatesbacteria bacterium]